MLVRSLFLVQFTPTSNQWFYEFYLQMVEKCRAMVTKDSKSFFYGLIIYFWWNIWNEGNRRTFRQEEKIMTELTYQIKEEVQQFQQATEVVNRIAHNLLVVSSVFVVCMVFFLCVVDWWWCIVGMGVVVF